MWRALHTVALWELAVCILLYFSGFIAEGVRTYVRRARAGGSGPVERKAHSSMVGMALEFASFGVVAGFHRPLSVMPPGGLLIAAMALAPAAMVFGWLATRTLGKELRVQAVVTEGHELITTGPYAVVRHPIYASAVAMMLAAAILLATPWSAAAGTTILILGTEIRVRAEDRILAAHFGPKFDAYRTRVKAYVPFVR